MKLRTEIIFMSATKIGDNTSNILNYYFSKKYALRGIKLNIYI